jgi:hypothetical protein
MMRLEMPMDDLPVVAIANTRCMDVLDRQDQQPEHTESGQGRDDSPAKPC